MDLLRLYDGRSIPREEEPFAVWTVTGVEFSGVRRERRRLRSEDHPFADARYEAPPRAAAGRFCSKSKKSRTLWRLGGICYNQEGSVENETLVFSLAELDCFAYCPYCP
jgi:hypothetical protein